MNKFLKEAKHARRSESESRHRHNENSTEFWGYVAVRPGAHMFYWLYHSYHHDGYLNRPLIIWLQVIHNQSRNQEFMWVVSPRPFPSFFSFLSFPSLHLYSSFPFLSFFHREATAVSSPAWSEADFPGRKHILVYLEPRNARLLAANIVLFLLNKIPNLKLCMILKCYVGDF